MAIYYPLYLKFGGSFFKIGNIVLFMLAFFGPSTVSNWLIENKDNPIVQSLYTFLTSVPEWMLTGLIMTLVLLIVFASAVISIRIYKNKEF